jgi:hypothetical protein
MNPILMNIVVETCAFFALCDDEVADDVAFKQIELIVRTLKQLSRDDQDRFVRHIGELAARAREERDDRRAGFLEELAGDFEPDLQPSESAVVP